MLKAYLHPKKKPNDRHWYAYDVVFDGEIIVADSRDPEHDLARVLLARGIKGNVTLHDGPTRKPRTVVNIEKAAPWCVGSNLERYMWKAPEVSDSSPHTGEDGYLVLPQCQTTIRLWHDQHPTFQFGPMFACVLRSDGSSSNSAGN